MAASFRQQSLNGQIPDALRELVAPHVESFDYFVSQGLQEVAHSIERVEIADVASGKGVHMWIDSPRLMKATLDDGSKRKVLPRECRESGMTYKGELHADVLMETSGGVVHRLPIMFGKIPIMVKSKLCHLEGLSQAELIKQGEESLEMGGYFICNGIERIVRMLILPKLNYPMSIRRGSFARKGSGFSDMACVIRCARADQTSLTNRLIYVQDGTAVMGFTYLKNEYFMPVGIILKALVDSSDSEIFQRLMSHVSSDSSSSLGTPFVGERSLLILSQPQNKGLSNRKDCLEYLGRNFRTVFQYPARRSDSYIGLKVLEKCVLVHLERPTDKFNLLIFMLQKLYSLVDGTAQEDNADTLQHHDLLLPGHLLTMVVKERLEGWLSSVKETALKEVKGKGGLRRFEDPSVMRKIVAKTNTNVGQKVEYLLNTGNLVSQSGLDLQQASGFTVVAEKLNFLRYISHFRSVHRGAFFSELRTTSVRKLLPESWGFMCPVHTPDGAPCGLLNHLAMPCRVVQDAHHPAHAALTVQRAVGAVLSLYGFLPVTANLPLGGPPERVSVLLDGCVLGTVDARVVHSVVEELRLRKVKSDSGIPGSLEVGHVPFSPMGTFPGLFLFSRSARMVRPVRQLFGPSPAVELIGPFEQVFMDIRCLDGYPSAPAGQATHEEMHPTSMLSVVANLTPWSDYNQSPRNMYQCQMGKQTMGVPVQTFQHRADGKLYRLQTPQTPIARTEAYDSYCMDDFPTGTNAVVAVLAYTGYDMEDAMIINKSSMERGFCHGQIYKTETLDLAAKSGRGNKINSIFALSRGRASMKQGAEQEEKIGADGLPEIGQRLSPGDPYCSVMDVGTGQTRLSKLKGTEAAVVDQVAVIGTGDKARNIQKANVKLRFARNPVIGDKFSSRHGQKGVLSQLWPDVDMPFTHRYGMRPDIIINPHAFPSRMTVGMLVESMAAKSGALEGKFVNATPFRTSNPQAPEHEWGSEKGRVVGRGQVQGGQEDGVVDYFGKRLAAQGFKYHGTEVMYSGVLGTELTCEIYIGLVYYQRLRHMVSDKFQVRSTGPVNPLTMQPVKGRKFGGGIRFGEMERDALMSHGAAYLLHDRLHRCSDYHTAHVCSLCGSLLSTRMEPPMADPASTMKLEGSVDSFARLRVTCQVCQSGRGVEKVAMPFVFKYLAAELAAMNIKVTLGLIDS